MTRAPLGERHHVTRVLAPWPLTGPECAPVVASWPSRRGLWLVAGVLWGGPALGDGDGRPVGLMVTIFELACPREMTPLPSRMLWLVFCSTLTHTQR
jgi:hypothetical protein